MRSHELSFTLFLSHELSFSLTNSLSHELSLSLDVVHVDELRRSAGLADLQSKRVEQCRAE
jgi:hypothetical protein